MRKIDDKITLSQKYTKLRYRAHLKPRRLLVIFIHAIETQSNQVTAGKIMNYTRTNNLHNEIPIPLTVSFIPCTT